ncbi:MAG: type II toxin-antitoxin system RelE/ParE family toxin [Gammaproteobacteria bacterium]
MIRSFRHRKLERFFKRSDQRGIPAQFVGRLSRMLDRLDTATNPQDMQLPGYRFHSLRGNRAGRYAVTVSGNWRLTFRFDGEDAVDVDLEDYH